MGKLTIKEAEKLQSEGVLDADTVKKMQTDGLISEGRRSNKRFLKTKDGSWVSPQLYFQGVNSKEYSKNMKELRSEFITLLDKYTVTKSETNIQ
tara:strand:- start:15322 stop:15603 length:282 start_codon:yes stop_codon:yes gene_type:complete